MSDLELPNLVVVKSRKEWRRWLIRNHRREEGAWLVLHKKRARDKGIQYEEAVQEAICFGWIDSKMRRIDDDTYAQRFSSRKKNSPWSEANKRVAFKMIGKGRMTKAGLKKMEEAKTNGNWGSR